PPPCPPLFPPTTLFRSREATIRHAHATPPDPGLHVALPARAAGTAAPAVRGDVARDRRDPAARRAARATGRAPRAREGARARGRSEEHTSELQSLTNLV